jgi:prepilin-type processing-associated H-X9-DG protein
MAADALGTAAGFTPAQRMPYENDGTTMAAVANHAYTLDPPRLTARSDIGTGSAGSMRSAVDARHMGRVNAVFLDQHAATSTLEKLGYRLEADGRFMGMAGATSGPESDGPSNRLFSGTGVDEDPPAVR